MESSETPRPEDVAGLLTSSHVYPQIPPSRRAAQSKILGTSAGIAAVFFWASSVAVQRLTSEALGTCTANSIAFMGGGLAGLLLELLRSFFNPELRRRRRERMLAQHMGHSITPSLRPTSQYVSIPSSDDRESAFEAAGDNDARHEDEHHEQRPLLPNSTSLSKFPASPSSASASLLMEQGSLATPTVLYSSSFSQFWHEMYLLVRSLDRRYTLMLGGLFMSSLTANSFSLGMATSRSSVTAVALVNQLWPAITVGISIPVLGRRLRGSIGMVLIAIGLACGVAGVAVVSAGSNQPASDSSDEDIQPNFLLDLFHNFAREPAAYMCALYSALSWSLYSNMAAKWGKRSSPFHLPLFLFVTGIFMALMALIMHEPAKWHPISGKSILAVIYLILGPTFSAYSCWELGLRRGLVGLVMASAYLNPCLSTICSCLVLGVPLTTSVLIGSVLLVGGASLSTIAVLPVEAAEEETVQ